MSSLPPPPSSLTQAAASADGSVSRKRPRHSDSHDDNDNVAPRPHLYKHALESIFGFLNLKELNHVLAVCKSWSSAVKSMRPIAASLCDIDIPLSSVCSSSLSRHVSCWSFNPYMCRGVGLNGNELLLLGMCLTNLRELRFTLSLPHRGVLVFPPKLELLALRIVESSNAAANINGVLIAVTRLKFMHTFLLHTKINDPLIDFAPLQQLPLLVKFCFNRNSVLTDDQGNQIRALPHLTDLALDRPPASLLCVLIRTPHSLRWKSIGDDITVNAKLSLSLSSLSSLTCLDICSISADCDLSFLARLTNLNTLIIRLNNPMPIHSFASLQTCVPLTDLILSGDITAAHMSALLPHLTSLQRLSLSDAISLDSLQFLSQGPITQTLTQFQLMSCQSPNLHIMELKHVNALKSLAQLLIFNSFTTPIDEFTRSQYTPPSKLLPKLISFSYVR